MRQAFWTRVKRCGGRPGGHKWSEMYSGYAGRCGQEEVGCSGPHEYHCLRCGVYETEDRCLVVVGQSGWPYRRWQKLWAKQALARREAARRGIVASVEADYMALPLMESTK